MLNFEQIKTIISELEKDTADEFVETVIHQYCTTSKNVSRMLTLIPEISSHHVEEKDLVERRYSRAVDALISIMIPNLSNRNKMPFIRILHLCRAHFPNGICESGRSPNESKVWEEFISRLNQKIEFDYSSEPDWRWLSLIDYTDWMLKVIRTNIDSNFEPPKL